MKMVIYTSKATKGIRLSVFIKFPVFLYEQLYISLYFICTTVYLIIFNTNKDIFINMYLTIMLHHIILYTNIIILYTIPYYAFPAVHGNASQIDQSVDGHSSPIDQSFDGTAI